MKINLKTLDGKTLDIEIENQPSYTVQKLKKSIQLIEGTPVNQQRLVYSGKLIQNDRTLDSYNIAGQNITIHLVKRLRGDIGIFDEYYQSNNRHLLCNLENQTQEHSRSLIEQFQGQKEATYFLTSIDLPQKISVGIISYANQKYAEALTNNLAIQQTEDLKIDLTKQELINLIGSEIIQKLQSIFGQTYQVVLRRCQAHGKMMDFHIDKFSVRTLQLSLNDDSQYKGGRLLYVLNGKIDIPKRNRGTITVHNNKIVHGVSLLQSGIRYGLFLLER